VPSGWFSDRVGRVTTLRIAAVSWVAAHAIFITVAAFPGAAAAQIMVAVGFAFASGTDVTFHYDTLESTGRSGEFTDREAAIRREHLLATAMAVLAGGGLGLIDLRLPFVAALVAAVIQVRITFGLVEPTATQSVGSALRELLAVVANFRNKMLAWVTIYVIGEVITVHLTSELAAPYLAGVLGEGLDQIERAPLANGIMAAIVALVGAIVVRSVGPVARRFGAVAVFLAVATIPVVTLAAMASATSVFVLPLLILRSIQTATASVLVPTIVAPRVKRRHRATVLSITSLAGRLAYGIVLISLAGASGFDSTLRWAAWIAGAVIVVVTTSAWFLVREDTNS